MPVAYTNRKGVTYYLRRTHTKTGKPRYVFAREPQGELMEQIPEGWHISESANGVVSLARDRPQQILPQEVAAVKAEVERHPKSRNYRIAVKDTRIEIYERTGPDADELLQRLAQRGLDVFTQAEELRADLDRHARFAPVLRFILADPERRTFYTQRWCYLGSIDDWIHVGPTGPVHLLAGQWVPRLGSDALFDVYL